LLALLYAWYLWQPYRAKAMRRAARQEGRTT
jgi:hypothetical protein